MAETKQDYEKLKKFALEQGISLFGVADISGIRDEFALNKALKSRIDRALSMGKRLLEGVLRDIKDKPTPLYFHHYRQVNFFLDRAAFLISDYIQDKGFLALPIPASQTLDWERQRGHLSHKKIGNLAGLGWIGRNNLLVNPDLGARFRLVTVLTDMPLELDKPLEFGCGECMKCIQPCPAHAIKEQREDFDHRACFEKLKGFRRQGLVGQYICGVCVKACSGFKRKQKKES
ncbi:MAG: epoxyqueuosine reductase [Candidatus Aminicenantes bacterium]|nr:MAG: epoxyqueuosine reductase [Candidatus Aminicenantes bacterium]